MSDPTNKVITMHEAVSRYVQNGDLVAIEGFTAFICFAAAHEIIRQGKQDLTLARMTPDLIYDQMIAAGVAKKLIFSYLGNPGVGNLNCIRRAVEKGVPRPLEVEEYTHFGMVGRYIAVASNLPFFPLRSFTGSDLPQANPKIQFVDSPYGDGPISVVPPLNPDVCFLHAQRADSQGNTQLWGLLGMQKEVAFASKKVVVVVEEIVDDDIVRRDPNRTLIPTGDRPDPNAQVAHRVIPAMNHVYGGDSLETMRSWESGIFHATITDPPYNVAGKRKGLVWAFSSHVIMEEQWDCFS